MSGPLTVDQLAFGFVSHGHLLRPELVRQYLDEKRSEAIPDQDHAIETIRNWTSSIRGLKSGAAKETSLEHNFVARILCDTLGYTLAPRADTACSAWFKPPSSISGIPKEPDLIIGRFAPDGSADIVGVVELKPPGTAFDVPQNREGRKTPVEQCLEYAQSILGARWAIVTDMLRLRLYAVDSPGSYESFDLSKCVSVSNEATPELRRLYFLLHHDFLVRGGRDSTTSRLLAKSSDKQIRIREEFYSVYYQIRADLFSAIAAATRQSGISCANDELLQATQRLLDRMLFLYYCEDHPDHLIPDNTVRDITESARRLPGPNPHKVYQALRMLFREVDAGSSPASGVQIPGYNGELFKEHHILDHIELPDELHDRRYVAEERHVNGVWGLHVFDFWSELNEHLLGHIFEESLSDVIELQRGEAPPLSEKLAERRRLGIFFTDQILSDFLVAHAVRDLVQEEETRALESDEEESDDDALKRRISRLLSLKVVDFACGSGAFLVSAFRELLSEISRDLSGLSQLLGTDGSGQIGFDYNADQGRPAQLLRRCLYGADLLPQAVELAKLALWLRSARKNERIPDLGGNLVAADSLRTRETFARLAVGAGEFDLVIGNPPWGGAIDQVTYQTACEQLGLPPTPRWDSWELFVALGIHALRPGGRLALVLPDTLLSPEKGRTRRLILENTRIERMHNLGPDWFGSRVRMGTVVLQARKGSPGFTNDFRAFLLMGNLRRRAIRGEVPLSQIESQKSRLVPQERCLASPTFEIELFRSREDDRVMEQIEANSVHLAELCERARGEEASKAGLLWICPSCLHATVPGKKRKGGGFHNKTCPTCSLVLTPDSVQVSRLVVDSPADNAVPFVDGDDISRRYVRVRPSKFLLANVSGWNQYKDPAIYEPPKILIRQAGVGILATIDETHARCPQSVYIYRLREEAAESGLSLEFILGALLSRTMGYYAFKKFGEVDPARAHAKVTHKRLALLPIPRVDLQARDCRRAHDLIKESVTRLLEGRATLGGREDLEIEITLRNLWGLTPEHGAFINAELGQLPAGQVVTDFFPPDGSIAPRSE